jgi:YihY family inner membrane protein
MDLLRPAHAFDRYQQHHRPLAIPLAVVKKFSDDQAGNMAALLAYYAFFSIFPLLLVFVTILGFVFHNDRSVQDSISKSVLARFPVIGTDLEGRELKGQTISLVIGILTSIWAGLGITRAAQNAFDKVWAVPFKHRSDFFRSRLRGFLCVVALGVLFVVSSVASGLVIGGLGGAWVKLAGLVFSLALNVALFAAAFRILTSAVIPTSKLWIGVAVGSVFWTGLQALAGWYVDNVIRRASNTYGFFATVIGLLAWLHLGGQLTLYAAELNVVIERKLWPRSLFSSPAIPGDERALEALAKVEERSDREHIDVHFR